jgi:hypothetical protein
MLAAAQVYQEGSNSARAPRDGTRQPRQLEQRPPLRRPARRGSNSRVLSWWGQGLRPLVSSESRWSPIRRGPIDHVVRRGQALGLLLGERPCVRTDPRYLVQPGSQNRGPWQPSRPRAPSLPASRSCQSPAIPAAEDVVGPQRKSEGRRFANGVGYVGQPAYWSYSNNRLKPGNPWRRRMGIEPTHRGLNPEHWI